MTVIRKVRRYGIGGSTKTLATRLWCRFKHRNEPVYANPTPAELAWISSALARAGVPVQAMSVPVDEFTRFKSRFPFPEEYHGGLEGGVWHEKMLEHFLAYRLCGLDDFGPSDIYLDVAAAASPWARMLRDKGVQAYAIDLAVPDTFQHLEYYRKMDATRTDFPDSSVAALSLQCAFEMFGGDSDVRLLAECGRLLKAGGKAVIAPLYMHTHHCGYSSPEYFRRGYADRGAKEYVCFDHYGIPFSRKYSAALLQTRILSTLEEQGMQFRVLEVTNQSELGPGIYCHFVLVLERI